MRVTCRFHVAVFSLIFASTLSAQELTTAQVLAKLDEKAKVFSSLEASLSQQEVSYGVKQPLQTGKIFIKPTSNGPRILMETTEPKAQATKAVVKEGEFIVYFPPQNTYRRGKIDPKHEGLQLLMTGFGVPASTLNRFYTPKVTGRETIDGIRAIVLELPSISTLTGSYSKVTLWLDPQTWTPVQTRLTEKSGDYFDFKYSKVKLNKGVSDSVFNVKIPKNAQKQ